MHAPVCLITEGNNELLSACLWQLMQVLSQEKQAQVLILGEASPAFQDELYRTACWFAYEQGFYQSQNKILPLKITCVPDLKAFQMIEHSDFFACPSYYSFEKDNAGEQELTLVFSDQVLELLDVLELNGLESNDEMLLAALEQDIEKQQSWIWINEGELEQKLRQFIQDSERFDGELLKDPELSALFHCLKDMEPARTLFLPQNLRSELDRLISLVLENPENENIQIILSLMRRRLSDSFPETTLLAEILPRERALQILKPVENLTVTIIVVTYNRLEWLKRNINGILAQTYQDWKLILLNHASTDGTKEYSRELAEQDPRIHLIEKEVNRGAGGVRQYLPEIFALVDTELFLMCPDDDWMAPQHLENLMSLYKKRPWISMAFSTYGLVNLEGNQHLQYGPLYPEEGVSNPYIELQRHLPAGICVQGAVLRLEANRAFVQWDPMVIPDFPYGIFDSLSSVYLQCLFEAAYSPENTFSVTSDDNSANAQNSNWNGRWWLSIMNAVTRCFQRLYGLDYCPYDISFHHYYKLTIDSTLLKLQQALSKPHEIDITFVKEHQVLLQDILSFCASDISKTNQTRDNLFVDQYTYGCLKAPEST